MLNSRKANIKFREKRALDKLSTISKVKSKKPTAYSLLVRTGVDAAASFQKRDFLAELPWTDWQRLVEVSAHASPARR